MKQSKAEALVSKAIIQLVNKAPFYGMIAMQLEWVPDPKLDPPTMGTDGFQVRYHVGHIENYPFRLIQSECAHEIGHNVYRHLTDRGSRDPELWNMAGDYRINGDLVEAGFPIGDDWLHDPKYNGMTTVEIYNDLAKQKKRARSGSEKDQMSKGGGQSKAGQGKKCNGYTEPKNGKNGHGHKHDDQAKGHGFGGHSKQEIENKAIDMVVQAMHAAKIAGKLPAGLERQLNKLLYPPVAWADEMRLFWEEVCKSDYSWKMPNPRYQQFECYIPKLHNEERKPIVIGIDTSGSITQEQYTNFLGATNDILEQVRPQEVIVLVIDAKLHQEFRYTIDDLPLKPVHLKGGGGTSFKPLFEWIEREQIDVAGAVYLTDLYGDQADIPEPDYPVLWASTTERMQGPWGSTVFVPMAD